MDNQGRIYRDSEAPKEDKARLDGYLMAKAEMGEKERALERLERAERKRRTPESHPKHAFE